MIDDSPLKRLIENTYGVGPTVVEGFMRATNLLVAATTFCVVGYGACGRGVARALRGDGATVLVVERDPVRALEAAFDGMRVRELHDALPEADVVITVTGSTGVIGADELELLRDDALLANAGHFSEIEPGGARPRRAADRPRLAARADPRARPRRDAQPDRGDRQPDPGDGPRVRAAGALAARART